MSINGLNPNALMLGMLALVALWFLLLNLLNFLSLRTTTGNARDGSKIPQSRRDHAVLARIARVAGRNQRRRRRVVVAAAAVAERPVHRGEAQANDLREMIISCVALGILLATLLVFGTWIVRAHRNLPPLGAENLDVRPGWALGYFFVPLANLWKPYTAMRTLWQASHYAPRWDLEDAPWWLVGWWVLWLVSAMLGRLVLSAVTHTATLDEWIATTKMFIASSMVDLALDGVAALLVYRIWKAQRTQYEQRCAVSAAATNHVVVTPQGAAS
jgi:hypothetical protein